MKNLLIYFKPYKKECIAGPAFKLFEAVLELLVPVVIASIIDKGILVPNTGHILRMGGILCILAFIGLICSITAQYFSAKAAVGFAGDVKSALFRHIGTLSFSDLDKIGTSSVITRMTSDMNQIQSGLNLTLRLLLRSPFVVFGAMIMAFTIDVRSALIFAAVIPVLFAVVFGIMSVSIPMYRKVQKHLDRIMLLTAENLSGTRVLRAFCREEREICEYKAAEDILTSMQKATGRISALMNPLTYIIINAAIAVLIYTGAVRVDMGILTSGQVVALYNYMSQILVELIKLANLIISITKSLACAKRVSLLLCVKPGILDGETDSIPDESNTDASAAVSFENVSLCYNNSTKPVLKNMSFSAGKGQRIGIIGGTGSGKSSLVNLIPRFYDVSSGRVCVDGKDVRDYPLKELRDKIGVVMQRSVLFKGTVRENMQWGKENASDEEIIEALKAAQAFDFLMDKGQGLDYGIEQEGRNLSGGQRQRLSVARALVKNPSVLILDDSSSALDYATDKRLRMAIREISASKTVFIVSQRTSSIQDADKIIVIDNGEICGMGKHDELLRDCRIYREIYSSQNTDEGVN